MFIQTYLYVEFNNTQSQILLNCSRIRDFTEGGTLHPDYTMACYSNDEFIYLAEPLKVIAAKIAALQPNVGNLIVTEQDGSKWLSLDAPS